jgi:general secretion pathway protein F
VIARLQAQGHLPLRISQTDLVSVRAFLNRDITGRGRPTKSGVADLIQRIASLTDGGVPIEEALRIIGGHEGHPVLRRVSQELLRRLRDGSQLADAMSAEPRAFTPIMVGMIRAGEASGSLGPTLTRLADYLRRTEATRQTIRSALIYPAILVVGAILAVILVLTVVLPELEPMVENVGSALPLPAQLAFAASDLVRGWWWAILLVMAGVTLVAYRLLSDPVGKMRRDKILLGLPVLGPTLLRAEVSRFSRTLGALIGGGLALPTAMALAAPVLSNAVVASAVERVTIRLREGGGLSEPLGRVALFPDLAIQMIRIGEATGRIDAMLLQVADIFDADVRRTVERSITLLVPALTVGLGALVGGIIASVMMAMLSLNDMVG